MKFKVARRRIVSAITGVTVGLTTFVGLAAPAEAATQFLILAENQNLSGRNWLYSTTTGTLRGPGDAASSVRNDTPYAWVLYDDTWWRDRNYCIRPGETVNNLHNSRWKFGDKISSVWRLNRTTCDRFTPFYSTL